MAEQGLELLAFNRGLISPLALARVDLKRSAFSAQVMVNWMPRTLGSMMLRPGLQYLGQYAGAPRNVPFIYRANDTATLEFTNGAMRVWINDALLMRNAVGTTVANSTFTADLSSWTSSDQAGATSSWVTNGAGGGYMNLLGNGIQAAQRDQQLTIAAGDQNVEQALRVVVNHGPVTLNIGKTQGSTEYANNLILDTGVHSIAFTPTTAAAWIRLKSFQSVNVTVTSCQIEGAGAMSIPSPYQLADLNNIRAGEISQSGNYVFVGCLGYQQRKVQRWAPHSWSLSLYLANDGPFRTENGGPITITPSAVSGNITLTASDSIFQTTHVGSLWQIASVGQQASQAVLAQNQFTNAIEVTGVGTTRTFTILISNTFNATVTLQSSLTSAAGPFTDVAGKTWTAPANTSYADGLDNQTIWYRIGVKTGGYVSGEADLTLSIGTGSINGVVRMTGYTDSTHMSAEVLTQLGGTAAVDTWSEGEWSDYRGWPTAAALYEGRLVWAGHDFIDGSTTDEFNVYAALNPDGSAVGDSGPIDRSIGFGPVDIIQWVLPLQRLLLGGEGAEFSIRADTLDNALTPTNFNLKPCSGQGSAPVMALKVDSNGMFVQRGGTRLMNLAFSGETFDYQPTDLTIFCPEVCGAPGSGVYIKRIALQRQPDTRVHCVLTDGTAAVLVYDHAENVMCWLKVASPGAGGIIEDVDVLPSQPGQREDQVYYSVQRTVNGTTVHYREKWALESDCQGSALNKQADAFIVFNQAASTTVGGLGHLIGATVVCWHDGICEESDSNGTIQTYVVNGAGQITLNTPGTTGVVGLAYTAQWQSNWLGALLAAWRRIDHCALMLQNTHWRGLYFGDTFNNLDPLPLISNGAQVPMDTVYSFYPPEPNVFPSDWQIDARLCLQALAPRPCTILAAVPKGATHG